jgi:hypothetical protein
MIWHVIGLPCLTCLFIRCSWSLHLLILGGRGGTVGPLLVAARGTEPVSKSPAPTRRPRLRVHDLLGRSNYRRSRPFRQSPPPESLPLWSRRQRSNSRLRAPTSNRCVFSALLQEHPSVRRGRLLPAERQPPPHQLKCLLRALRPTTRMTRIKVLIPRHRTQQKISAASRLAMRTITKTRTTLRSLLSKMILWLNSGEALLCYRSPRRKSCVLLGSVFRVSPLLLEKRLLAQLAPNIPWLRLHDQRGARTVLSLKLLNTKN